MTPTSEERVYVAIDVNNLWHSCREVFGVDARVDYSAIKNLIQNRQTETRPRRLTLVAYAISLPYRKVDDTGKTVKQYASRNSRFLYYLAALGYDVKTRKMREEKGTKKAFHTDWDVGITIDAINAADDYDTFVLASGDGDYALLLRELHDRGKKTEVVTVEQRTSSLLYAVADSILFISKNEIFIETRTKQGDHGNRTKKDSPSE